MLVCVLVMMTEFALHEVQHQCSVESGADERPTQSVWNHSSHRSHSIIVSPYVSGIRQIQNSSVSLYGKCLDLYPHYSLVGKCGKKFFRQSRRWSLILHWSNSISFKLSPSNLCRANAIANTPQSFTPLCCWTGGTFTIRWGATSSPSSLLMTRDR